MNKFGKKIITLAIAGACLVGTLGVAGGTQVASAASDRQKVGGGVWTWSTIPGLMSSSAYYHPSKTHSASAQVGTGKLIRDVRVAGQTASSTAYGIGTTYVYWNVYR